MAARAKRRRRRWGNLIVAVVLFAVAIAVLFAVPASPLDRTHVTSDTNPAQVTLPPTAPLPTPTISISPTTSRSATPTPTR
jgi:hypothetical protein